MKTILAFGDSLTYGADAASGGRHPYEDRWPTVLERALEGKARVIAEGHGGRTTVFDEHSSAADRNGANILPVMLASHSPLDAVIIMLGTNDLKPYVCGTAVGAAFGMKRLVQIIRSFPYGIDSSVPDVIMVAPPHVVATDNADLGPMFRGAIAESHHFAEHYARLANELDCAFFDASTVAVATPLDGVHLDAANTRAIGAALAPVVSRLLRI
ncbi:MAG TPA: SGNH/GDSL hydrolase family protein [Devosiaceae bacterium]